MWWIREYLGTNEYHRPYLIYVRNAKNIEMTGVRWMNSPCFHIMINDFDTGYFHDFEIHVDSKGQLELNHLFGGSNGLLPSVTLPTYALNTDGLDVSGVNVVIERLNITNFDDAVAIKPLSKDNVRAHCSEGITVRDLNVYYGVGMSVGTLVPHDSYNCVRNVTFTNIKFYHPFKAVYVKSNPGETTSMLPGSGGEVSNIVYDGLEVHRPLWWGIYIGPQQQKQPH